MLFLMLGCLACIVCIISMTACSETTTKDDPDDISEEVEEPVLAIRPKLVKVYIDASGSMADYFGNKDIDITTISDAISSIAQVPDSFMVEYYVWGNDNQISRNALTSRLLKKDLKGKSSYFHEIFQPMEAISHADTLAVLITDGILSSASAQTKLSGKYTDYNKGYLETEIQRALEGKGKAISLYRMIGNFNGKYFNKSNAPVPYQGKRPFYVLVMGDPDNVRYFAGEAKKGHIKDVYTDAEVMHIGTHPKGMNVRIHPLESGDESLAHAEDLERRPGTDTYDYTGEIGFRLGAKLPKWLLDNYDPKTIKAMSEVQIDGQKAAINIEVDNRTVTFTIPESEVKKKADIGNTYTITYLMRDPSSGAWDAYSVDDDTTPDSISTYLLKDFIGAMRKGIIGNETDMLKSTIIIDPTGSGSEE